MKKILLGIFICLCSVLLMSHNIYAVEISEQVTFVKGYFYPYWSDNNGKTYSTGGYQYSTNGDYATSNIQYFRTSSNSALTANAGQYVSLTGSIVISVNSQSQAVSIQANPRQYFSISSSNTDCQILDLQYDDQQYQTQGTTWLLRYSFSSVCRMKSNVTNNVAMNFNLNGNSTSGTDYLNFIPQYIAVWKQAGSFDDSDIIAAINRLNTTITGIVDKFDDLKDVIEQGQEQEQEATENIENQTPEDISSEGQTENTQTTSIINVFGGFLSALSGVNTGSCVVNLPFPSYAGGTWQMNICQNKDKAGNIVSLFGSATMIFFFLPVAWRLLGMIYNEIRSFTNG